MRPPLLKPLPVLPPTTEVSKREFKLDLAPGQTGVIDTWKEPGLIFELQVALNDGQRQRRVRKAAFALRVGRASRRGRAA